MITNTALVRDRSISLLSILLLTLILFLFLQPTVAGMIHPSRGSELLGDFLAASKQTNHIDGQKFWETREFYAPGSFKYRHDGFPKEKTNEILQPMDIHTQNLNDSIPFLTYHSSQWKSIELLITQPKITDVIDTKSLNRDGIFYQSPTELIYYKDQETLYVVFIKDSKEMQTANGFFDYPGYDKEYVKGKYWLSISEVKM